MLRKTIQHSLARKKEGFYLYDKPERYAVEKAFINKKPYVTKKGISRPGRVTVLSDDRDSAKRVRALYDWVERDKPKEQEPKRRPFEDDSIINKDALKDPKTLKAVADIFDKADRRTVVASEEGDVRVEYDVSKDGKPIPGTTRVLDKGRVMITDFAIDPKLGLDGSLSRTKKWVEGLNGGPKDTLAIYVNPETKAVRFTGRGAERVSQENGIDLEEVVPRMNREGIPVIVMIGNRARVAWPGERPSGQEAPVSAPEAKPQEAPTATPAPSKPQAPAQEPKPVPEPQEASTPTSQVKPTQADKHKENEKRGQEEAPSSVKARLEDAGLEDVEMDTEGKLSFARVVGMLGKGRIEDISFVVKALLVKEGMVPKNSIVIDLGGDYWTAWDESADVLTDMIPGILPSTRAGRHFVAIAKRTDGDPSTQLVSGGHTVIKHLQRADDPKSWNVYVERPPANIRSGQQPAQAPKSAPETQPKPQSAPKETSKPSATKAEQEALGELESLMGDLGMLRESGRRSPWRSSSQTGMLREPERNDEAKTLTPEQLTAVQNAMNKVVAASVETAGVRSFDAITQRLFGLVGTQKPALWKAMRPYLRGAWVTYGDTHEALDLDEPSRADVKAVFERVERGEVEPQAPAPEPAQEPQPQAEPTATPAAPAQQPAQPEPVAQAPQSAPQPATTDWASAKNGEIRLGEDGKAYIRWEDYWLTPATGKSRKWVGSRKRGRMEPVEVEGVNVHDRMPDGKPGAQAKVFFEPDGRWVNPNNGKVHYGHMQALVDDPKNGHRWTALDRWADDGNPRADMANAREAMGRGTLGAVTEPQQKEDEHERTGIQSASGQVGGAVGGQEPSRDGGDGVGGVGSGVPGRGVPVPGGVDVSSGLAGEQPAEGVSDDAAGVGGRAGERGEDGGAVSGATLPVQPEGGDRGVRAGGDAEQSAGGDGGRGQGAAQGVQPPAQEPNHLTDDRTATANYVIPEAGNGGLDAIANARERIAANLAALRVLKALQKEGRQATVAEQRTLSLYTGWGSLGEQLFNDQTPDWSEERAELKGLLTEAEYASARRTVQYAHYTPMDVVRGMYDALGLIGVRGANLSAYEAGLGVGRFIGGLPEGLRGTRYTGVEMDPLTAAIAAQLYPQATVVNEKYQDVPAPHGQFDFIVGNPPYGNIKLSDRSFPDGNGQSLHNFFIMKQIEALRPGGVAAFLVTHYFLDAQDQSARLWIHQRAQFLGAIRMPNALFKTVDASLATDIVFFRKRLPGEVVPSVVGEKKKGKGKKRDDEETGVAAIPRESQWVYTDTVTQLGRDENNKNPDGLPLRINMAFSPNRTVYDMRAVYYSPGDSQANAWPSVVASTRYGKDRPQADLVVHGPAPTREGIYNTLTRMPIRTFLTGAFQPYTERVLTEQEARERLSTTQAAKLGGGAAHPSLLAGGHFVGADGKLYYTTKRFDGQLVAWPVKPYDEAAEKAAYATNPRMTQAKKGKPARPAPFKRWKDVRDPYTKFTPQEQGIMKTIAALREVRFDLMQEELSENADEARLTELRKRLNEAYADFQKAATGYAGTKRRPPALNDREIKALMFADPASSQLLGLETLKKDKSGEIEEVVKGAVFFRRVNEPKWRPLEHYDKAMDALVANLSETGAIDLDWIMARTGKGREAVLDELRERVYIDPETERPVLREQYLSGDVKTKWEVAKQAVAEGKTEYARNVEALGTVIPADIAIEDLYVPFGSSIVTGEMVGRFAQSEMGFVHRDDVKATFNTQTGTWEVDVKNVPKDLSGRYFVANRSFKDVMKAALNNKGLTVYEKDEQGNSIKNKEATEQVAETIRQIRDQWEMWWPSSPFAAEIGKTYNARYNRIAEAQYDGAFLKFQGLNPALTPYRHQRDAVWRTIVTGNVLYNHVVGSGKTNTAILSIMEMKRMGRVRKPVVVVPNHLVEQWRNDFLAAYPGANVLATDDSDMSAENRKRYFARIQNGDYDVIILPHKHISHIPLSPDVLKELVARQIAKYREALEELVRNGAEKYTINRIEKMIERMEAHIDAKIKALRTDETGLFFDTLGIDGLFLDEAHEFKNVPFVSAVQAKGMGNPGGANKALDLLMKVNWMRQKRAGAPVVFMTGTPVSNSLTELYLNMLYMAPDLLEKAKLNSMDAFLQSFGLVDERMEVATTGQFKVARRLRKLMNVPELMRMVRTYMDVIDADDLRGSMEAIGRAYDVPELETGAPINVVAKRSPLQEIYFGKEVAKRQKADGSFEREFNVGSIYYRAGHMPQDPSEDNMLKLTNDAMAASLDIRLRKRELIAMGVPESELTDEALDFAGSKVNLCVAQIVKDYKRFDAVKGTQMVFCDRSIPGSARSSIAKDLEKKRKELETARKAAEREELDPTAGFRQRDEDEESPAEKVAKLEREVRALEQELESGFSVYDDIKRKLVAQGIPAEEIAFIHDYETKEKKQALFDRMNAGKVRVLLGSTSRMGAGTNANKRMVSMHHLDAPWRPSDMEQRNGRIIRQGNLLMKEIPDFKVRVYQYGTEKSADAFKFSTLLEKGRAFHGIYKRTNTTRNVEEIGDGEMSSEQMMAQLSGSLLMPLMIEQREGVQTLERQARNHNAKRRNLVDARDNTDAQTPIIQDNLARARRVTELATERPDTKENYYAGIDLRDRDGNPIALNAKTMRERLDEQHGEPIAKLLHLGATIRYRGLEWVSTQRTSQTGDLFDVYEEVKAYAPNDASAEGRPLVMTTQYDVNGAKDDAIIIRMNNAIDKARQSIPIFERQLKANAEELAKLDRQLAEYPEAFPKNQELLEAKREFADIERCVNADATTAAEARVTLSHYYGQKGLPVPDYTWTRPEFDEKHGVGNSQQAGRLREPKWERELREHLAREGKTEADLSPETQAYLNAKREREAVMPKGAFGQAADFLGEAVRPREDETREVEVHWEFAGFVNRPLIPSLGHCSIGTGLGGLPMALHPDALGLFAVLVARDAPMAFHPGLRRRGLLGRVGGEDAGCARRGLLGLLGRGGLHHDGLLGRRLHHHRRRLPDDGRRDWQRQPEGAMPPHARPEREDATPGADAHAPTPRGRPVPTRWGRRGPAWGPSRRPAPSHPRPARQQHHGHRQRSHAPRSFPSSHSIPFPIRPRKRASLQGEAVEGAEEVGDVDLAFVDEGGAEEGRAEVLGPEGVAGGEVGGVEATVGGGDEHAVAGADGGALDGAHGAVGVGGGEDEALADGEAPAFLQGRAVEGDEAGVDGRQQDELLGEEGLAAVLDAEAEVFAPQHLAGAGLQLEEALAGGDPDGLAVGCGDGAAEAEVGVGLAPEEFAGGGVGGAERVPVGTEDDGAIGEGGAVGGAFAEAPAAALPAFLAGGGVEGGEALAGAGVEGVVGEGHAADEAGEGRVGEFGLPDLGAVVGGEGVGPTLGILGVDARAVGGDGVFDGGAGVGVPQFLAGGGVEGRHAALVAQVFVGDAEEEAAAAVRDGGGEEDLAADGDAPEGLGARGGGLGERGVTEVGAGGAVGGDAHEAEGADGAVDAALLRGVGAEGLDGALAAGVVEVPVAVEPGAEAVGGEVDPAVIEAFAGAEEVVAEDDQRGAGGQEGEVVAQPGGDLAGGVGGAVVAAGHGEDDVVGAAGVEGIPRGAVEALEERLAVGAFHQIVVADGPEDGHAHVLEEGLVLAEAALIADVAGVDDEGGPFLPRQIPQPLGHRAVVGLLPAGHLRVRDMDEGVRPLRRGRPGGECEVVAAALRLDGDPMARHARAVGHRERDEARLGVVGGEGKTPLRVGADDVEAVGDRRARARGLARVPLAVAVRVPENRAGDGRGGRPHPKRHRAEEECVLHEKSFRPYETISRPFAARPNTPPASLVACGTHLPTAHLPRLSCRCMGLGG